MFDYVIKNGEIFDGTGAQGVFGDIGVSGDTITAIGRIEDAGNAKIIDATGLSVAPGFIDMHTHSDFTLFADGRAESQVHQGVTTEVMGQCGLSCAPVCDHSHIRSVSPWYTELDHMPHWHSYGEYLDALSQVDLGVNVMGFVGHGTVHKAVLGDALRAGDPDEVSRMTRMVEEALDQGAGGFSSGLEYWPGILAAPDHLVPMCMAAAARGKLYATHVRNRDTQYDLGFAEALATARQSGARLQISHIQPKFGAPRHAMEHTLEMIEVARRYDVDVAFDVIPHDWNNTLMASILPQWAQEGGVDDVLKRLADPECRARIKANPKPMWLLVKAERWSDIVLLHAAANRELVGADFAEIGRMRNCHPYDAVLDILAEEGENMLSVFWASRSFTDADIDLCLSQPECGVISDTIAAASDGILREHVGSITGYGWAARFLQYYVRDRSVLSLSEALRKITQIPAQRLGLEDRGELARGKRADICVFDPANIASNCSARYPRRYASGIAHVMVNGQLSMHNGLRTNINAGAVLRM
ncbi:MAG: N-acyl-D-amino-acid deacylase family protein [Limimaricola soesokkakensis]|uniref:N-acyl-D-amino-acid deacylase family protein n=1 Tax=Limimaricola soesokkakensis TaxID=1343159 RepID=UPI004058CFC3